MSTQVDVSIVVVPFPAHGHLNQILHFSLLLSSYGLPMHFACSATHNRQARTRVQGWHPNAIDSIRFHDLPLPAFHIPNPNPDADNGFPAHIQPMLDASDNLRAPIADLLCSLAETCRRLIVVHDPLMSFAGFDAASTLPNAEAYCFPCLSAFFLLSFFHVENLRKLTEEPKNLDLILQSFDDILTEEFMQFVGRRWIDNPLGSGTIINTNRALDGEFLDLLGRQPSSKKVFAIGPVNPLAPVTTEGGSRNECLQWLDKQPPASVLYVSFGTTSTISDEQIEELAVGLQRSGQRFIWVLRDADRGDIFADGRECRRRNLPPGFEEETEKVGFVVREFAPQLEILAHGSTGGFMSHCGWNSCMESLSMGVPILAWPMHSDQPKNASMVSEYLKAGVTVRDWSSRGDVVSSAIIEESIKRVFVEDQEIRKRAQSLGEAVRAAVSDGGTSKADLDSFISHIRRV